MTKTISGIIGVAVLVVGFILGSLGGHKATTPVTPALGGTSYDVMNLVGGAKIGEAGTTLTRVNGGICYIKAYATTIAASSTATVDCQAKAAVGSSTTPGTALKGVKYNDPVIVNLSTTTAGTTFAGLILAGASASSTQGYITLRLSNLTGGTFTWPTTGIATGTASYIVPAIQ